MKSSLAAPLLLVAPLLFCHCNSGPTPTPPADLAATPADAASPPSDAARSPGVYGGHCDAPPPTIAKVGWNHAVGANYATSLGGPNHRLRDLILAPGEKGMKLRGRFTYGAVDKDLEDEKIEVWFQRCPNWEKWGTLVTSSDGVVWADVPDNLPPGDYRVRMVVLGDLTSADGVIAVWRAGVKAIVTDVDGTITTSDWELFKDVIFGPDAAMYPDADKSTQAWAKKDYRLVYLTGRPQMINRYTRRWLARRNIPFGPLQLTEDGLQVAPTNEGVGIFKADFLKDLQSRVGVNFIAAYGNAATDIYAYEKASIPKAHTYIIGPNAGHDGTVAIPSYTDHLPRIAAYPDAVQP